MKKGSIKASKQQGAEAMAMGAMAAVFFVVWGLVVNWEYGIAARWQVGVTQALVSFSSTAWSAWVIGLFVRNLSGSRLKRALLGGGMSWVVIYSLISFVHWLAGTPDIIETMAPGLVIGLVFCPSYAFRVTVMP